jgi:hypothetical protein
VRVGFFLAGAEAVMRWFRVDVTLGYVAIARTMRSKHSSAASRAGPEGAKIERARAPKGRLPIANAGSHSAPAAVDFQQVEGAKHIREACLWSHPATQSRALVVRGTSGGCALPTRDMSWGAARDGLPCIPLLVAHSLAHLPQLYEGATSRRYCERSNAASSRAPALPRNRRSSLARPSWTGLRGILGEGGGAGIRRHDICFGPEADIAYASNLSHPHPAWVKSTCRISPFRPSGLGRPSACPSWP